MKTLTIIITLFSFLFLSASTLAQFDIEKKIKRKLEKEAEKEIDKGIDKGYEEGKEVITNGGDDNKGENDKNEKDRQKSETDKDPIKTVDTQTDQSPHDDDSKKELKIWSKYDFVPGENVIFEDDLSGEESGEFPSRWDLLSGSAEVASLGDGNVIHLTHNNSIVIPLMDKQDFLPEVFTVEFDLFFEKDGATRSDIYKIRFYEGTNNSATVDGKKTSPVEIRWNDVKLGQFGGKTTSYIEEKKNWHPKWKHIAIAFNKRSLKLYMDEERLLNIPNLGFKPKMFSIGGHFDERYIKMSSIKNIRVNEGGKKLYDRILEEGKFVTRGILFGVNKATINGESMGTINEIVTLMKKHPDLNFRIEGHTDSDGEESFNQKLSEDRAAAVKSMLGKLGIDASRLESKGWGESKPVSENSTPEGKANNRRVEFIKF